MIFLKHKKFVDVCIRVLTAQVVLDETDINGVFWNLGQVESFEMGACPITLKISGPEQENWEYCDVKGIPKSLRTANWKPLTYKEST